jgi:hypothetical protein
MIVKMVPGQKECNFVRNLHLITIAILFQPAPFL